VTNTSQSKQETFLLWISFTLCPFAKKNA
jgi:hypothetical protein